MKIYQKIDKATELVSVIAVQDKDKNITGKIIFKFPKDGAGRLHVFIQEYGNAPIHGYAGGWGYDKKGAALYDAYDKAKKAYKKECLELPALYKALEHIDSDGQYWHILKDAGYSLSDLC